MRDKNVSIRDEVEEANPPKQLAFLMNDSPYCCYQQKTGILFYDVFIGVCK